MFLLLKGFLRFVSKLLFFVKVEGYENVPEDGAIIFAANHTSFWDPVVLVSCTKRRMRTMAKKELFDNWFLKPFLKIAGAFPVARGTNDITAIKTALGSLKNGEVFMIFPAGTRMKTDDAQSAKAGVALISSRSKTPVIPIAICGGFKPFHRVTIVFGKPMELIPADGKKATSEELQTFADDIMAEIHRLGAR